VRRIWCAGDFGFRACSAIARTPGPTRQEWKTLGWLAGSSFFGRAVAHFSWAGLLGWHGIFLVAFYKRKTEVPKQLLSLIIKLKCFAPAALLVLNDLK
jgi:hypothetical protein